MKKKVNNTFSAELQNLDEQQIANLFPKFAKMKAELEALGCTVKVKVAEIKVSVTRYEPDEKKG